VGRVGPRCEFAACPAATDTINTLTFVDKRAGFSFDYPVELGTQFISLVDWPPKLNIINEPFVCAPAGSETARAGKTENRLVNGRTYCVTTEIEGAAGSIYAQYAYAAKINAKTAILTFSLRLPQCGNYPAPTSTVCERERQNFAIDPIVDRIFSSIKFEPPIPADGLGTVRGRVLLGPICPLTRIPPDPACADKPYAAKLAITSINGTKVYKEFSADEEGIFKIKMPAGEYSLHSAAEANILPRCSVPAPFRIVAGRETEIAVSCDTGIR
jgi:hypothetical protein